MRSLRNIVAPLALLLLGFLTHPAEASHSKRHHSHSHHYSYRHHPHHHYRHRLAVQRVDRCTLTNEGRRICSSTAQPTSRAVLSTPNNGRRVRSAEAGQIIGSRPAGCPHAYCGCGLRKYLGLADTRLNLARNWARLFPREPSARAGLAAVRNHHVMYVQASAGDGRWLVRDYNSGGGVSRLHVRDLRGYVFVNPAAQIASH